jgi:succinylarginine dihydrolase
MLNQVMTKRAHQALKQVNQNKEVNKEILSLLQRMKDENVKQLVEQANTVDIHRTQGSIRTLDTLTTLFATPEIYNEFFDKE